MNRRGKGVWMRKPGRQECMGQTLHGPVVRAHTICICLPTRSLRCLQL